VGKEIIKPTFDRDKIILIIGCRSLTLSIEEAKILIAQIQRLIGFIEG